MTDRYVANVVLADPPWEFHSTAGGGSRRDVTRQYPTMTVAEIRALDHQLRQVVEPIARCFLWCPDSNLEAGYEVLRAWGFRPAKIAFVWTKLSKRELTEKEVKQAIERGDRQVIYTPEHGWRGLVFGAGRTTRNGSEVCLLGARGSMPVADRGQRQVLLAPVREHSRKPDETYERIEAMYPEARYLELFARQRRRRWAAAGNETDKFTAETATA